MKLIDTIVRTFRADLEWVNLHEKNGSRRGIFGCFRTFTGDDTWDRVFTALIVQARVDEDLNWAWRVPKVLDGP